MGKKKFTYAASIFIKGGHILLLRELGKDGYPLSSFHLPGCLIRHQGREEENLKASLLKKYKVNVRVISTLSPINSQYRGFNTTMLGFLCENLSPFVFPEKNFEVRYVAFDELNDYFIDPIDKLVCLKTALFAPVLLGKRRRIALDEVSKSEAKTYLDCLDFFGKRIPRREVAYFMLLKGSDSTIFDIRKAFRFILEIYGCDYAEYLDYLAYKEKHLGEKR